MPERTQQNIVFENAWRKDDPALISLVKKCWKTHFNIPDEEIERRIGELVFVIHDEEGNIAGISTAKKAYIKQLRNYLYGVRFMISPEFRSPGLMSKLVMTTRDFLEAVYKDETPSAIGLIALIENENIKKHLRAPILSSGFVYIGNSSAGHHIRVYYFKGSHITPQ